MKKKLCVGQAGHKHEVVQLASEEAMQYARLNSTELRQYARLNVTELRQYARLNSTELVACRVGSVQRSLVREVYS